MARRDQSTVAVRLARSLPRLLAVPLLAVAAAVALALVGILLVGGMPGMAMAGGGAVLALVGLLGAAVPLSVRVHVEESVVRVSWLFGRRIYLLTPGSLTRVHLHGEGASPLRSGFRFGWALGPAVLRNVEEIHVVRLARTETVILIPTARGRLAIATSDEQHLIETLTNAARARARAEEPLESAPQPAVEALPPPGVEPFDPRLLTGIERALDEEGLARQRTAVGPAATVAAVSAVEASAGRTAVDPISEAIPSAQPRRIFRRPSWARRRAGRLAMIPTPAVPERVRALPIRRPRPSWLLPVLPLAAAGAAWAIGVYVGRMPESGSDGARLTALALVLAGPATTIGAVMARTWWPRVAGVVVTGGLTASVFIARSLLAF